MALEAQPCTGSESPSGTTANYGSDTEALWRADRFISLPECGNPFAEDQAKQKKLCDEAIAKSKAEYRVTVEKCGPAEDEKALASVPMPPGAVVCTIALQKGAGEEPRGHMALFFYAAGKWNAQLVM